MIHSNQGLSSSYFIVDPSSNLTQGAVKKTESDSQLYPTVAEKGPLTIL